MGFLDLFRPKWRHSDAAVRAEAVRDLDDAGALKRVAHSDPDARVRKLAQKKIDDPRTLMELAAQETDEGLRKAATERAQELLLSTATARPGRGGNADEATDDDAVDFEAEALEAVSTLGEDSSKIFVEIARRAHFASVRKAAAERVGEPRSLAELARASDDAAVRTLAVERLARQRAVDALRDVAVADKTPRETGLQALDVLSGQKKHELLVEVTREAGNKDVALAALAQVPAADVTTLADLAARVKSKAVRQAARERLPATVVPAAAPSAKCGGKGGKAPRTGAPTEQELIRRARLLQLCRAAEAAAQQTDLIAAEAAMAEVRAAWAQVVPPAQPTEESGKRFARAEAQLRARHDAHQRRLQKQAEAAAQAATKAQAVDAVGAQRLALCERVERLPGDANLPAQVQAVQAEWAALGEVPRGSQALERRFERACDDALKRQRQGEERRKRAQRLQALVGEAEALQGNAIEVTGALRKLWKEWERLTGGSPAENAKLAEMAPLGELSGRLQRVRERIEGLRQDEERRQQAEAAVMGERVSTLVARLSDVAKSEDRKRVDAALKELREVSERGELLRALPSKQQGEWRDQLRTLREQLSARASELRETEDWKRWANVPRLEALVAKMEALLAYVNTPAPDSSDAAEGGSTSEVSAAPVAPAAAPSAAPAATPAADPAQAPPPSSQSPAFDAVSAEWLATAAELHGEAPAAPGAEPAAEPAPAPAAAPHRPVGPDLVQAQKHLRQLQSEWKTVGPAPKEKSEALWQRFKAAADQIHERGQAHFSQQREARADNLKKKEELVAQAEALLASLAGLAPTDAKGGKAASDALKRLQAEWKAIGPVAREHKEAGDALWKRFRAACDQFFAQRKHEAVARDEERSQNLKRQEELAARAEALAESSDWKVAAERLKKLQADWKAAGPGPRDQKEASDALWLRFRAACDRFFERRKAHFDEQDAERQANLAKKHALCQQVEALIASEEYPGEDDTVEMIKRFMAEWKTIGPVPKEQSELVWQRFQGACDKLRERRWALPAVPEAAGSRFENKLQLGDVARRLGIAPESKG